jgi:hypothetical protein
MQSGVDTNLKTTIAHRTTKSLFLLALPMNLLSGKKLLTESQSDEERDLSTPGGGGEEGGLREASLEIYVWYLKFQ